MSIVPSSLTPLVQHPTLQEQSDCPAGGLGTAIYFGAGARQLFGWLHAAEDSSAGEVGLVICRPLGYEGLCAHRGLRAFAEAAQAIGVPTLRFDYLGTGDSAEIDPRADQLTTWTQDVIAAVDELRRRSGVRRVCLLGVRLGALLAVLAAGEHRAITSLVLISPIISGRRYLRELRTTRLAGSLIDQGGSEGRTGAVDSMEVSGFLFSAATLASLREIDLNSCAAPLADLLVIDGNSLPVARAWSEQLASSGARVKYLALPGLIEMIMTAPQFAAVPLQMIAATREWLLGLRSDGSAGQQHEVRQTEAFPPAIELRQGDSTKATVLTERPVFFGEDPVLFGIVTEPRRDEIRRRAVILLNAGADAHIGVNRMHVDLAREWAGKGYVALRMDLAGIGDSGTRAGQRDDEVFPPAVLDDIRAAVAFMRERYGAGEVTLFGLCSGAYHALRAAAAGVAVNRILMVNPQNYFWKEGMRLDDLQLAEVVHNPGLYRRQLFSPAAWRRLLGGRVNLWRIVKIYFYRPLLAVESTLRDIARSLHIRLPNDLGSELEDIYRRGVRIVFVFARGEPGIDLLKLEAGSSVKALGDYCRIYTVDGADHVFSQSAPRAAMKKIISIELFAKS